MTMRCAGPLHGVYSKKEAAALGRPAIEGHRKRGIPVEKMVVVTGKDGAPERIKLTAYEPCGNDLTALIDKVPADGTVYDIECPKCGGIATVRKTPADAPAGE